MPMTAIGRAYPAFSYRTPMSAYVIATVTDAWDQEALVEYRKGNTVAVENHGGRFVVRGGEVEVLEGETAPLRVIVIEFPDMDAARAWYTSDEYAPLREQRRSASTTDIVLVDGVPT
jgi:uncharacterized protein (DUF1330 family)